MIYRPPSYQQCVLISKIARNGGTMADAELRSQLGYATNVIGALIERNFIREPVAGVWQLTEWGNDVARELLGAQCRE